MATTAIKSKDLSPRLGGVTPEEVKRMIDGMKAYRDYIDGIDENYALGFQVDATGNGFTVVYTWCKGEVLGYGHGPDRVDSEPILGSGRFFIIGTESYRDLAKYIDGVFDEVTSVPYDENFELFDERETGAE